MRSARPDRSHRDPTRCRSRWPTPASAAPTCTSCTATWTPGSRMPLIFGHEMSGTIAALGDGRHRAGRSGDPVTVMPLDWDGTCPACLAGTPAHLPEPGLHRHRLPRLAAEPLERARGDARRGCPRTCRSTTRRWSSRSAVAVHDVRRGELAAGEQGRRDRRRADRRPHRDRRPALRRRGRWSSSPTPQRRAQSRALGLRRRSTRRATTRSPGSRSGPAAPGADVVFEVSGAAAAVLGATALAKVRGTARGRRHPSRRPRPVDLQRVFWRELRILGARVYERADFETAVELLAAGVIPADALITAHRPAVETPRTRSTISSAARAMKILVDCRAATRVTGRSST